MIFISQNRGLAAICRLATILTRACLLSACGVIALITPASPSVALDPDRSIRQYHHTAWGRADGAPGTINHIAQTPDGYLWLASDDGLFRFDGIRFERIDTKIDHIVEGPPYALLATQNGELWTYYAESKRFAVFRRGRLERLSVPWIDGTVIGLTQTPNGDIWIAGGRIGQTMLRYRRGAWSEINPNSGYGSDVNMGMVVTADGALWVAYSNNIFRLPAGRSRFEHMISEPDGHMRLSVDPAGRVWVTGGKGSRPITEERGRWTGDKLRPSYPSDNFARRGLPMFDRDGNLWIARRKDGLERLRRPSANGSPASAQTFSEFRSSDGLTSDAAKAIFEDREGNIWVATTLGLDRFRDVDFGIEPQLGQPAAFGDILFADDDGNVFIGQRNTVFRVRPASSPEPILTGVTEPEAICEGPDKSIWIVLSDHIAVFRGERQTRYPRPSSLQTSVQGCGVDRWGNLWMSAGESGVFRRTGASWTPYQIKSSSKVRAGLMVIDKSRDLWMNAGGTKLVRFDRNGPVIIDLKPLGNLKDIRTITPTAKGLLLARSGSLGRFERGNLAIASASQIATLFLPNGIAQTPQGDTWIFDRNGLTRFSTTELERTFSRPDLKASGRTFNFLDGLIDSNAVRTLRTLVLGGDGRLWAATATGTVWMEPAKLVINPVAPKVAIGSFESENQRLLDPREVYVPSGRSNITIGFAALSLRMPERVQVRYRLEGQDRTWINPGARRDAYYTNLGPGTYRFHVIAANEHGVWNRQGATMQFSIAPTFVQTVWFKLLAAVGLIALLAALYLFRLRQVTARLSSNFGVRIAERERIARELHDTLLQGFQGLLLQFKAVANSLPQDNHTRQSLDKSLQRAQHVLIEGRDRVKDLRGLLTADDLTDSLAQSAASAVFGSEIQVELTEEGEPRPVHPLVQDELVRIVEEALRNAVAHARPSSINLLLIWSTNQLRISVRDDGVGMPASVLLNGNREGHFGLVGMRERAERVGGKFVVNSRERAGTEVALVVNARTAYLDCPAPLFDRVWMQIARAWRKVT